MEATPILRRFDGRYVPGAPSCSTPTLASSHLLTSSESERFCIWFDWTERLPSSRGDVSGETRSIESVRFLVAFAIADLRKVATVITKREF